MTSQKDLNKDFVALFSTLTDSVHKLKEAVSIINVELKDLKSSQNIRNENFNDRLINQEVKELNKGYADLSQRMDSQHMRNNNFTKSFTFILNPHLNQQHNLVNPPSYNLKCSHLTIHYLK